MSPGPDDAPLAPFPFNKPTADLVLRSRKGLDFRIRSQIIIEASPVMDAKLAGLRSSIQYGGSASILDMAEDSSTLELLLRICYPIVNPPLDNLPLEDLETALRAALGYEMELPVAMLVEELSRRAEHAPISVWSAACRTRREDVAGRAAERMLTFASLDLEHFNDLTGITAGQLFRLRKFFRLQGAVDNIFRFNEMLGSDVTSEHVPLPPYTFVLPVSDTPPDLILQSSDGYTYNAHQDVLRMMSTVLCSQINAKLLVSDRTVVKRMQKKNTVNTRHSCNRPHVRIELEDVGSVLSAMLAFCYRLGSDVLDRIPPSTLAAVIGAAMRYNMHYLLPDLGARWSSISSREPLCSYFAAANLGLSEFAAQSARDVLKVKLDESYLPQMESSAAEVYRCLVIYYESCQAVARTLLIPSLQQAPQPESPPPRSWSVTPSSTRPPTPSAPPRSRTLDWWKKVNEDHTLIIDNGPGRLGLPTISLHETATEEGLWCPMCQSFAQELADFSQRLREVPRRVSEVTFPF
ncbi:hypothetical protein C8Q73DRAFT_669704 [Cubamyces lactineus]|nr:hypothetical protein C8Q73DRAFT_669704 [Cubamyces lactineus]